MHEAIITTSSTSHVTDQRQPAALRIVSWNTGGNTDVDNSLNGFDLALLQETSVGSTERIESGPGPTAVNLLNGDLVLRPISFATIPEAAAKPEAQPASYPGTIAASELLRPDGSVALILASVYVKWEKTGSWIVPDASAHRTISDISALITTERHRTPILVAGDWNMFRGAGETPYWQVRYQSVFDRMDALGFEWVGPSAGLHRQPSRTGVVTAWPSTATPTFHTRRESASEAWRQLDHVFVSKPWADAVTVRALNEPNEWGPSDHCRIEISVDLERLGL